MSKINDAFQNCCQDKKTSYEWYKYDTSCDIADPDGWDRSAREHKDWFEEEITLKEYVFRRD